MSEQHDSNKNKAYIQNYLNKTLDTMKQSFNKNPYPTYDERKQVLLKLKDALIDNEQKIYDAIREDYGYRSDYDSLITDVLPSIMLIKYTLKNLRKWMRPSRRQSGMMLFPSKIKVHYQPLGVVGVITPWNFPIYLSLGPSIQAVAAGNRVMIKMSEETPKTTKVLQSILKDISDYIYVVDDMKDSGPVFSKLRFDHLVFTGSTAVGQLVAQSAAQNLTPITLELGGKSPTIIAQDANMNMTVDAIINGKSINSGQICVAPDYIFVHESKSREFIETFRQRYAEYHIESSNSNEHTHIINAKQLKRLHDFIDDAQAKGGEIHPIKHHDDRGSKLMLPHIVTGVTNDMTVMNEEIFGSVLPLMTYKHMDEVLEYINARQRPLALYIMTTNKKLINKIIKQTHSGGVSVNDTAMHVMADDAPFGGIGYSGMGHYHGHEGFLTFSKSKTVLTSMPWLPKNRFILKNRDRVFRSLQKSLLK